ncbi:ABC transporter permease [Phocaeicola paurosaccharolyticus]|uniref:ABC transporter permease n=1 Tax=Phocaeicola paurosaccharolyticus TaxID=732242 RepID=UPI0011DD27A0|nr:ABC transporter permease [Phocaeicola paurosaccharolyticus]
MMSLFRRVYNIAKREIFSIVTKPVYLLSMVIAPLFCYIFFTTLMWSGLPSEMPVGIVDLDNTGTTRNVIRNLDAFQHTKIVNEYPDFTHARKAIQKNEIYAFFYIPRGTTEKAISGRQPKISFYTNYSYLVAGSLLYKDLRTMSELASGAIARASLRAKGANDQQAINFIQPVVINTHALGNPWLNYSIYLSNSIIPGVLMLMIFLTTIYSVGSELKFGTQKEWLDKSGGSIIVALTGKLLPQTFIFFLMSLLYNIYLYGYLHFPCNSGIMTMILIGLLLVLASQGFGLFLIGLVPSLRLALSIGCLWGVVSFSISGMSFPVMAMDAPLQTLAYLFPLRSYFLLYVNFALHGYSIIYAWLPLIIMIAFISLPIFILKRLKNTMINYVYIP